VEIEVRNLQRKFPVDRERAVALAGKALRAVGLENAQVSIVYVSDRRIREMNRRYRHRNAPTDVLAFSQTEGEHAGINPDLMGDVVISVETAARQASEEGHPLENELDLLAVHGILHLAGFDHTGSEAEKRKMERWTKKILPGRRP
jgi:probable rRNA maturation factor